MVCGECMLLQMLFEPRPAGCLAIASLAESSKHSGGSPEQLADYRNTLHSELTPQPSISDHGKRKRYPV